MRLLTHKVCVWLTLLVLHYCSRSTAVRHLVVPSNPVVASAGRDAILPCSLSPSTSAVAMAIRWFKDEHFVDYLYLYDNGKGSAGKGYEGKVNLFSPELEKGNVSLLVRNLVVSDSGRYKCQANHEAWVEEMSVDLQVIQQGSVPRISLTKHHRTSTELSCSSDSWSLAPSMIWTDHNGKEIAAKTPKPTTTQNGLFSIASHVRIGKDLLDGVWCVVMSKERSERLESTIQITEEFFMGSIPDRMYISAILLPLFLGLFSITASVIFALNTKKDAKQKLKPLDKMQKELTKIEEEKKSCQDRLEEEKHLRERFGKISDSVWKLIVAHKEEVILDPDTAHPRLLLSEENKVVRFDDNLQEFQENQKRFEDQQCVLAMDGYDSGMHYWEVDLGEKTQWSVGVAEEPVNRGSTLQTYPENGFWSIGFKDKTLKTVERKPTDFPTEVYPKRLGVLLDYEGGMITFFNAEKRYFLYCFSGTFTKKLYPFFGPLVGCNKELKLLRKN